MSRPALGLLEAGDAQTTRRGFLSQAVRGLALAAAGLLAAALARFLEPPLTTPAPGPVELGRPEEYALGSLLSVPEGRAYLGRDEGGFYALLAVCTHLGCTPRLEASGFVCPCHGSKFARDGEVMLGPATRPLDRAFVSHAPNGRLVLHPSRLVDAAYRLPS